MLQRTGAMEVAHIKQEGIPVSRLIRKEIYIDDKLTKKHPARTHELYTDGYVPYNPKILKDLYNKKKYKYITQKQVSQIEIRTTHFTPELTPAALYVPRLIRAVYNTAKRKSSKTLAYTISTYAREQIKDMLISNRTIQNDILHCCDAELAFIKKYITRLHIYTNQKKLKLDTTRPPTYYTDLMTGILTHPTPAFTPDQLATLAYMSAKYSGSTNPIYLCNTTNTAAKLECDMVRATYSTQHRTALISNIQAATTKFISKLYKNILEIRMPWFIIEEYIESFIVHVDKFLSNYKARGNFGSEYYDADNDPDLISKNAQVCLFLSMIPIKDTEFYAEYRRVYQLDWYMHFPRKDLYATMDAKIPLYVRVMYSIEKIKRYMLPDHIAEYASLTKLVKYYRRNAIQYACQWYLVASNSGLSFDLAQVIKMISLSHVITRCINEKDFYCNELIKCLTTIHLDITWGLFIKATQRGAGGSLAVSDTSYGAPCVMSDFMHDLYKNQGLKVFIDTAVKIPAEYITELTLGEYIWRFIKISNFNISMNVHGNICDAEIDNWFKQTCDFLSELNYGDEFTVRLARQYIPDVLMYAIVVMPDLVLYRHATDKLLKHNRDLVVDVYRRYRGGDLSTSLTSEAVRYLSAYIKRRGTSDMYKVILGSPVPEYVEKAFEMLPREYKTSFRNFILGMCNSSYLHSIIYPRLNNFAITPPVRLSYTPTFMRFAVSKFGQYINLFDTAEFIYTQRDMKCYYNSKKNSIVSDTYDLEIRISLGLGYSMFRPGIMDTIEGAETIISQISKYKLVIHYQTLTALYNGVDNLLKKHCADQYESVHSGGPLTYEKNLKRILVLFNKLAIPGIRIGY